MYSSQNPIKVTQDIADRLTRLIGTRIPIPVKPEPGEGIADLLYRAACLNGFSSIGQMLGQRPNWGYSHHSFAIGLHDLIGMGDRLGTPHGDDDLALLDYRPVHLPDRRNRIASFFGAHLPSRALTGYRRLSPGALRKFPQSRAIWHVNALDFDPETLELLVDGCPRCGKKLNFKRTIGVCLCDACRFDFRELTQEKIDVKDAEALSFVVGLIDPTTPIEKKKTQLLHPALRSENLGQIFFLCVLAALALDGAAIPNANERRILNSARVTADSLAIAGRGILNWPGGFLEIIAEFEEKAAFLSTSSHRPTFAGLCRATEAVSITLIQSVRDIVAEGGSFGRAVGSICGNALVRHDPKNLIEARERSRERVRLAFERLRKTKAMLRNASKIGLPPLAFFNCLLVGTFDQRTISLTNWEGEIPDLTFESVPVSSNGLTLPIKRLLRARKSNFGDPWPAIIRAILQKQLPVVRSGPSQYGLRSLHVADFPTWLEFLNSVEYVDETIDCQCNLKDAHFYLNTTKAIAYPKHLGERVNNVTLRKLQAFDEKFIFPEEISDRLWLRGEKGTNKHVRKKLLEFGFHPSPDFILRSEADVFFDF